MRLFNRSKKTSKLRVIETARDLESINQAVLKGYRPLLKAVERSNEIRVKFAVFQNKATGEVAVSSDYRSRLEYNDQFERIIDYTYYYPYQFRSPFAAYLIPEDIKVGERVLLEDLIEDYVGARWNQGDSYRLESCEAIWNGKDFDIDYQPYDGPTMVG